MSYVPHGVPGKWVILLNESFTEGLDTDRWDTRDGWTDQNNVTDLASNIDVTGGFCYLRLSNPQHGAAMSTKSYRFEVGHVVEARIKFAGSGQTVYNWPAFWTTAEDHWPVGGEIDIFEGEGRASGTTHWGADNRQSTFYMPGVWAGAFHTYAAHRLADHVDYWWDGKLIKTLPIHDDGSPHTVILTMGAANEVVVGQLGEMVVDYVRAWKAV